MPCYHGRGLGMVAPDGRRAAAPQPLMTLMPQLLLLAAAAAALLAPAAAAQNAYLGCYEQGLLLDYLGGSDFMALADCRELVVGSGQPYLAYGVQSGEGGAARRRTAVW